MKEAGLVAWGGTKEVQTRGCCFASWERQNVRGCPA